MQRPDALSLMAVNDPADPRALAHRLRRDSIHGRWSVPVRASEVHASEGALHLGEHTLPCFQHRNPEEIPWHRVQAEEPLVVVESSGAWTRGVDARRHLSPAVSTVVCAWNPLEEPADVDATLCIGINEEHYDPRHHRVVSNASCTTNCIAPVVKVLDDAFGLERGLVTNVHGVTNNQVVLDSAHPDPRRARSALLHLIPTPSVAARAVGRVLPSLKGKLEGYGVRAPAPHGALVDVVAQLRRQVTEEELAAAFRAAAEGSLMGILGVEDEELVSGDYIGESRSAVVDLDLLQHVDGTLVRVVAWYDNEVGYAHRLADLLAHIGRRWAAVATATEAVPAPATAVTP